MRSCHGWSLSSSRSDSKSMKALLAVGCQPNDAVPAVGLRTSSARLASSDSGRDESRNKAAARSPDLPTSEPLLLVAGSRPDRSSPSFRSHRVTVFSCNTDSIGVRFFTPFASGGRLHQPKDFMNQLYRPPEKKSASPSDRQSTRVSIFVSKTGKTRQGSSVRREPKLRIIKTVRDNKQTRGRTDTHSSDRIKPPNLPPPNSELHLG